MNKGIQQEFHIRAHLRLERRALKLSRAAPKLQNAMHQSRAIRIDPLCDAPNALEAQLSIDGVLGLLGETAQGSAIVALPNTFGSSVHDAHHEQARCALGDI